jgi:hypothetical protein
MQQIETIPALPQAAKGIHSIYPLTQRLTMTLSTLRTAARFLTVALLLGCMATGLAGEHAKGGLGEIHEGLAFGLCASVAVHVLTGQAWFLKLYKKEG